LTERKGKKGDWKQASTLYDPRKNYGSVGGIRRTEESKRVVPQLGVKKEKRPEKKGGIED